MVNSNYKAQRIKKVLTVNKLATIAKIVDHFKPQLEGGNFDSLSLAMDIDAVNDINPMNLEAMAKNLNSIHVAHDVLGIILNFDRKNKTLMNDWTPRYSLPHQAITEAPTRSELC